MSYHFERGRSNVHYLYASYDLLVKAFGDDGTTIPRDEERVQAQWDFEGEAEVYDYRSTIPKEEVTEWHVQGSMTGIGRMLDLVAAAVEED